MDLYRVVGERPWADWLGYEHWKELVREGLEAQR